MNPRPCVRWRNFVAFALAVVSAVGCGLADSSNRVAGKVRVDGKPLRFGTVTFFGADGSQASAPIGPDGEYRIANVRTGDAAIAVFEDAPTPFGFDHTPRPADPGQKKIGGVPERYNDPARSGLTYKVKKGEQSHNIDLKP